VAGHIFQARPVWIYTQNNITNIIFTWAHNTNTEKIIYLIYLIYLNNNVQIYYLKFFYTYQVRRPKSSYYLGSVYMQTGKKSNLDENLKFSVCSHEIGTKIIFQRIARHFLFFLQCFTAKIPYTKTYLLLVLS
jgi:hypothetical protein